MSASPTNHVSASADSAQPLGKTWRSDIQGIRAIAVLAVFAYHAGLPVPGGFAGVDVFFVISGYVITLMLTREWQQTGKVRFGHFWWRRFKRLVPALGLMVSVAVAASFLLLSPLGPLQNAAATGFGAMTISGNVIISRITGDYFDPPASLNPLLNTWSLSVEEQFYLVFPLLLVLVLLLMRAGKRFVAVLLVLTLVGLSFALNLVGTFHGVGPRSEWAIGYYGTVGRAWEFGVGVVLALLPSLRIPGGVFGREMVAWIGLVAVMASFLVITDESSFPGWIALLPVLGTSALLIAGTSGETTVARAMSIRPMMWVGDRSYSIYLWHWPFIVLAVAIWPRETTVPLISGLLSILVASIAYRFVEQKWRGNTPMSRRAASALIVFSFVAPAILSITVFLLAERLLKPSFLSTANTFALQGETSEQSFSNDFMNWSQPCPSDTWIPTILSPDGTPLCNQSNPSIEPSVVLIGDSHAAQLFPSLAASYPEENVVFINSLGSPLIGSDVVENAWIRRFLREHPTISHVMLTAFWRLRGVDQPGLMETIRQAGQEDAKVLLLDDAPTFVFDADACKFRRSLVLSRECTQPINIGQNEARQITEQLIEVADGTSAILLPTAKYFCTDRVCSMERDGQVLYRDTHHLNREGADFLVDSLMGNFPSELPSKGALR